MLSKIVIILQLLIFTYAFAKDTTTCSVSPLLYINPILTVSHRIPVQYAQNYWQTFNSAGIYFEVPSFLRQTHCLAGIEAAKIWNKPKTISINCVYLQFGFSYEYTLPVKNISILPSVSLTNTMITDKKVSDVITNDEIFANVEDEFGIDLSIEPRIYFKHLFFGIPVRFERTFSSPEYFDQFLVSLNIGYKIPL